MKYRVKVEGHGFAKAVDGSVVRCGFFANRFLEAASAEVASLRAVASVTSRPDISQQLCGGQTPKPRLGAVEALEWTSQMPSVEDQGLVWYEEK